MSAHSALMALRSVPELSLKPPVVVLDLHLEGEKQIFFMFPHSAPLVKEYIILNKKANPPRSRKTPNEDSYY